MAWACILRGIAVYYWRNNRSENTFTGGIVMNHIDAKGKACPMPVMMAKKEMDTGCEALCLLYTSDAADEL